MSRRRNSDIAEIRAIVQAWALVQRDPKPWEYEVFWPLDQDAVQVSVWQRVGPNIGGFLQFSIRIEGIETARISTFSKLAELVYARLDRGRAEAIEWWEGA